MAGGSKTVSVSPDLHGAASETGELFGRTVGEQIEHWVRLGRALEASPGTTQARIIQALGNPLPRNALAHLDNPSVFAAVVANYAAPTEEMKQQYRDLGAAGEAALRNAGSSDAP